MSASSFRMLLLALAALAAGSLGACGREPAPLEQVRVLRMNPTALVTKERPATTRVRAALTAPARAQPPAVQVPQIGSRALGLPHRGRLVNGLQLPASGPDWVTWDPVLRRVPNRPWRRWGSDRLLEFLLDVLRDYRLANPGAPRVVVGDLSRPLGGPFGRRFGGLGHASHQNGLDVDVYYPRRDRRPLAPRRVGQVDRMLAQDLLNRFVGWGAQFAFVGLRVGLTGPDWIVQPIPHHDDHVHVRIANWRR